MRDCGCVECAQRRIREREAGAIETYRNRGTRVIETCRDRGTRVIERIMVIVIAIKREDGTVKKIDGIKGES